MLARGIPVSAIWTLMHATTVVEDKAIETLGAVRWATPVTGRAAAMTLDTTLQLLVDVVANGTVTHAASAVPQLGRWAREALDVVGSKAGGARVVAAVAVTARAVIPFPALCELHFTRCVAECVKGHAGLAFLQRRTLNTGCFAAATESVC